MGTCELPMSDFSEIYQKRLDIKEKLEGRLFLDGHPALVYGLKLDFPVVAKDGQCSCNGVHFAWSSLERWSAISGPVNLKS